MKLFLKILAVIIAIPISYIVFLIIASVVAPDIQAEDHSDVYIGAEDIFVPAESDNAYYALIIPYDENSSTDVEVRNSLREAAEKQYFFCPNYRDGFFLETEICELNDVRNISKRIEKIALAEAEQGNVNAAMTDAFQLVQLGDKMMSSQGLVIDYLVGLSIKHTGIEVIKKVTEEYPIQKSVAAQYADDLVEYGNNPDDLKQIFKTDYTQLYNSDPLRGKLPTSYLVQPNRYYKDLADLARERIKVASMSCSEISDPARSNYSEFDNKWASFRETLWLSPFKQNAVYLVVGSVVASSFTSIYTKPCVTDSLLEETITQLQSI